MSEQAMTRLQALAVQVSLTERGLSFVHVAPNAGALWTAVRLFSREISYRGVRADPKTRFVRAALAWASEDRVPYLFVQAAHLLEPEVLEGVLRIAACSPASKRKPVIFYVE